MDSVVDMGDRMNLEIKKQELKRIINVFSENLKYYKNPQNNFNEQMTRQQYIDVFLSLLGWDISNPNGLSFKDREVVAEEYSIANSKDRPDYTIRINGMSRFYVEAKKVNIDISLDIKSALQARRYGWNAGHAISILTNFEYLAIYLTYEMPRETDSVSKYRYRIYHYTEYEDKFEEIYELLSRDSLIDGTFNKWIESIRPEDATKTSLDNVFLTQLNDWRILIANDLLSKGVDLEPFGNINECIQTFLNQLVFLRFAEDNRFENKNSLKHKILSHESYKDYFKVLDIKYNSGLFENSSIIMELSESVLNDIVENLYFPNVSYDFSIIELSILSKIYENFLQQEIIINNGKATLEKTKSAKIKSVISTPNEIVVAMVKQGLTDKIAGKSVEEILNLRIIDISVGSGIFLIETYNFLVKHLVDLYTNKNNRFVDEKVVPFIVKRSLIEKVLLGLDINNQAVQITRFSLLLRLLSNEDKERIEDISPILPSLTKSIICANSLVDDSDIDITSIETNTLYEIMPMRREVGADMCFDIILGNPPYLKKEDIINSTPGEEIKAYEEKYESAFKQYDKYFLFIEKIVSLLNEKGKSILLVPNKFFNVASAIKLREYLLREKCVAKIFDFGSKQLFRDVINYVCVLELEKHHGTSFVYTKVLTPDEIYNNKNGLVFDISKLDSSHWFLTDDYSIRNKYEYAKEKFPCIEEEIIPTNGIQTSKNSIYKISKDTISSIENGIVKIVKNGIEFKIEKELLREFYLPSRYDGVNKSYQNLKATNYVLFPYIDGKIIHAEEMMTRYPNAWAYLNYFKDELLPKTMGGTRDVKGNEGDFEWYQYGRSQALREVDKEKIIVGVLSKEPNFNIDRNNMAYSSGGTAGYIGLYLKDNSKYNLEYIQAWLSHWFTDEIFKTIGSDFEGGFYTHGTNMYKDIPLLPIDFDNKFELDVFNQITKLVQRVSISNRDLECENNPIKKELSLRVKENMISKINTLIDDLLELKVQETNEY